MSSPGSPEQRPSTVDRDVILGRRALVLGIAAFVVIVVIAVVSLVRGGDDDAPLAAADDPLASSDLGPVGGTPVEAYIRERAAELETLDERRVAVFSAHDYVDLERIQQGLEAAGDFEVIAHLVALPGDLPHVTRDVERLLGAVASDARDQLEELTQLAPTVDDPEFRSFYEAEIVRFQKLLAAADEGRVVFGAVVIGSADDLRMLAETPGVRFVDVGPTDRLSEGATVRGLRPEEQDISGLPEARP